MEDFKKKTTSGDLPDESSYPASIEKMSEKWREIRGQEAPAEKRSFFERNYLPVGLGVGLLIIAFLVVIGGLAFLVWIAK
ncbi:MAG: hypothetical protein ACKVX9_17730 [Blastocatellia bacterium]